MFDLLGFQAKRVVSWAFQTPRRNDKQKKIAYSSGNALFTMCHISIFIRSATIAYGSVCVSSLKMGSC